MNRVPHFRSAQLFLLLTLLPVLGGLWTHPVQGGSGATELDPKQANAEALGERLFLETRFAEYFFRKSPSTVNPIPQQLPADPSLARLPKDQNQWIENPNKGTTMSCAGCHLVDQADSIEGGGPRSYNDFAARSGIPAREDGQVFAPRNSPTLIDILSQEDSQGRSLTHFDGEFASIEELSIAGLTGRNNGWLLHEKSAAIQHIARVIREDAGERLSEDPVFQRSYTELFSGNSKEFPLFDSIRLDPAQSSDREILERVGQLIGIYIRSLHFSQDEGGLHNGSPYDAFLEANGLPRGPYSGETSISYARRLREKIESLDSPVFVGMSEPEARPMTRHSQAFRFGPTELQGMKVFFREGGVANVLRPAGNCIECHAPPLFTNSGFHSLGIAQLDYDSVHVFGSFAALDWKNLSWRTPGIPSEKHPESFDAGAWHTLSNPHPLRSKSLLRDLLCPALSSCTDESLLTASIGRFKTPTLRNLGQSAPYFHNGSKSTLSETVALYVQLSQLQRSGDLLNADPALHRVEISGRDIPALVKFLEALNEDYE